MVRPHLTGPSRTYRTVRCFPCKSMTGGLLAPGAFGTIPDKTLQHSDARRLLASAFPKSKLAFVRASGHTAHLQGRNRMRSRAGKDSHCDQQAAHGSTTGGSPF